MSSVSATRSAVPWGPLAVMLCLTVTGSASAALENLALHRPWVSSDEVLPGWTGLTDGVADSDTAPGCFATANSDQFPKQTVVDLGAVCTVSRVVLHNSALGNTRHVELHTSADALTWEKLREYYFPREQVQPLTHNFAARPVRYVKVVMHDSWEDGAQGAHVLFLRELQVFGQRPPGAAAAGAQEELRLARLQAPLVSTPAVSVFRRYCGPERGALRVGVLGDGYAAASDEQPYPWPLVLAELLEAGYGPGGVESVNLAAPEQTPAQGLELLGTLEGEQPVDVVLLAYGRDAARRGVDPVSFRNQWQALAEELSRRLSALVVVVTPPPLLGAPVPEGRSSLALGLVIEDAARLAGLPLVRSGSVLASTTDPLGAYTAEGQLSESGAQALARAVHRMLGGGPR